MEIKHVCQSCGEVMAVHEHSSWQEIKDCQTGMRALCAECRTWRDALSPKRRTRAGAKGTVIFDTEAYRLTEMAALSAEGIRG